ncbi:DinB family protein [Acinetobacter sp. MD2(2019)]|uniref:DinB family protein n=1 Tax=Acinetobacter sp. MD2(2019) TaxID=2605273 RepID=UPI002D1F8087|nr:DinB family protein [Acinetobacter sp. MD2(2019)]MEB3752744.1 DinB family protein [Acinetobacter sp. MD2(2019)]
MDVQSVQYFANYHVWATRRLMLSLQQVSDSDFHAQVGLFFQSIFGTLNHLLLGERDLWLARFMQQQTPILALNTVVESDRQQLMQQYLDTTLKWQTFVNGLGQTKPDKELHYTTSIGLNVSLPFVASLFHVFNHATHHRGQITAAMTALGYVCPSLDMVYYLLEQNTA